LICPPAVSSHWVPPEERALDKVALELLDGHAHHCVVAAAAPGTALICVSTSIQ
jgi:DNA-binding FrmR family transcriptional regulator